MPYENAQVVAPVSVIEIVAVPEEATDVDVRHLRPDEPDASVTVTVPPELVHATATLVVLAGATPISEAANTAHSLASPNPLPILEPLSAALRAPRN